MLWTPGQVINIFITDTEYKKYITYILYYHVQPYISMRLNFIDTPIDSDLIIYVTQSLSGGISTNGKQNHGFIILNPLNLLFAKMTDIEKPPTYKSSDFSWARYTILREFANVLNLKNINQNSCDINTDDCDIDDSSCGINECDPHDPYSILNVPGLIAKSKFNKSQYTLDAFSPGDIEWLQQHYGNEVDDNFDAMFKDI